MRAREALEDARKAVEHHRAVLWAIELNGRTKSSGEAVRVSGGLPSSPVERDAIWNLTEGAELLERLNSERDRLETQISNGLALIEKARAGLGEEVAGIVEAYYIDARPWDWVSEEYRISTRHARRIRDMVCTWLDEAPG